MKYFDKIHILHVLSTNYGHIFDPDFRLTQNLSSHFEYLIEKYKLEDDEIYILYYILNVDYSLYSSKTDDSFHLIVSFYNEHKLSRAIELLITLCFNLQNIFIKDVHIFYESSSTGDDINLITETLYLLQNELKLDIKMEYSYHRPSFRYAFKYCNKLTGNTILSNTDIVYDKSLSKIQKIQENNMLCISRKNKQLDGGWDIITLQLDPDKPQDLRNIFSHDTWIFKSPMKYPIFIDIHLGEMFCDSYLNYKLFQNKYKCYNLANDIHCYHIQRDASHSEIISKNEELINDQMEKLIYRENGNPDFIYALEITNIEDFYNNINSNFFYKHRDFVETFIEPFIDTKLHEVPCDDVIEDDAIDDDEISL